MKSIHNIEILEVYPIDDYQLELTFSNDETYIVNFLPLLDYPAFEHLKDLSKFKQFALINGTLQWKENVDIAPEFLYSFAQKNALIVSK